MPAAQILLVEDSPDDEMLMLDALSRCGLNIQIAVARDGAEALDCLHPKDDGTDHPPPRLVLLDLKLPKVGGLEVLRRLRAHPRTKYVPVVILTSSSQVEDIQKAYDNGANAYVRKPIDFQQFLESVRCLEQFWISFNETV